MKIEETNKEPKICAMRGRSDGEWHESEHEQRIECREDGVTNTITGVAKDCMVVEPTQEVLGWVRDSKGNVIKRHEVDVANTVTAGKRDNTQNYVKEQIPLNTDQDGLATTVTTAHHYSGNIVDPKRGQKEMGVMEVIKEQIVLNACKDGTAATLKSENMRASDKCITEPIGGFAKMGVMEFCDNHIKIKNATKDEKQNCAKEKIVLHEDGDGEFTTFTNYTPALPFRVRRLTERELFRLMDVSEEDIDKIQAAGISKTQQAKMAGNSICVNVLYHIFRKMFVEAERETAQLELF